jgi:ABC-type amino acid transport substrate-binding protein
MREKWFAILVLFCLLGLPCRADLHSIIRIAGDEDYPPYEFVDKSGAYKGFNVDIIRAVGIEMSIDIELLPMAWNHAQQALERGEVDVIQGMTYSDQRAKKYVFSDAVEAPSPG